MKIHSVTEIKRGWLLLLSVAIALVTFPLMNPVYANGIDPPLSWIFNYLIRGRLLLGKDIIFPHGPLAFVMYPLPMGANLIIALVLHFLARTGFAYGLLLLRPVGKRYEMLISALFAFILLALLDILLVVIGLVILGYLHYLKSPNSWWLLTSFILSALAIYIKAFVGIVCGLISFAFFVILLIGIVRKEAPFKQLYLALIPAFLLVSVWLVMYGTIAGLPRYFNGMMQLAGDNSAAVSYYPDNNWVLISISFGLMAVLFFLHYRKSLSWKYMALILPALFAVWKYGMAREDYLHSGMYFLYVVMVLLILNLLVSYYRLLTFFVGIAIIFLSYVNLRNAYYFEPPVFSVSGVHNLGALLFDYTYITDTCIKGSARNTKRNSLNPEIKGMIGNSTVDVFPWDYSYIPVNDLNWQPRPVLQSYASYTPWLDEENAKHFRSMKAAGFLIWELRKITHDIHNGTLESIDGRYLLNDQPEAVLAILSNYRLVKKQGGTFPVMLLEKRKSPLSFNRKIIKTEKCSWDSWIEVPETTQGILRVRTILDRNWLGGMKSFLYKDEACYVYYRLLNDEVRMYRIVPKNAAQGIWVNPLFMNAENDLVEPIVKSLMFRCSNPGMMKSGIPVAWEQITFSKDASADSSGNYSFKETCLLLGKDKLAGNNVLMNSVNDLESSYAYWSFNPDPDRTGKAFSGETSCKVSGESFSMSCYVPTDSLASLANDSTWLIRTSAWINSDQKPEGLLVISLEKDGKSMLWKPVELDRFLIENNSWNYACNFLEVTHSMVSSPGMKLKVYIWNKGKNPFWIDNMQVRIERQGE